jgi:hypothetical protein
MVAEVEENTPGKRMRLALREALRARDMAAMSALRSALAAIDNTSAVPIGLRLPQAPPARIRGHRPRYRRPGDD